MSIIAAVPINAYKKYAQPIVNPPKSPNASLGNAYGPPVIGKADPSSVYGSARNATRIPVRSKPYRNDGPVTEAITAGREKMPEPIMPPTDTQVRPSNPISFFSFECSDVSDFSSTIFFSCNHHRAPVTSNSTLARWLRCRVCLRPAAKRSTGLLRLHHL